MDTNTTNTNTNTDNNINVTIKKTAGRHCLPMNYPDGPFTINQLKELNPQLCTLTIRHHVDKDMKNNIVKLFSTSGTKTGTRGKPAFLYQKLDQKVMDENTIPVSMENTEQNQSSMESEGVTEPVTVGSNS